MICVKKYERCWCNASDWDADPIDIEQPNSPTTNNENNKTNKQPLGNNRTKARTKPSSLKPVQMPPPNGDDEELDWNENLHLHRYCAKVQSQVPFREPLPGWSNWRNEISMATKNKSLNPNDKKGNKHITPEETPTNIIIKDPKTISQKEFNKM